MPTIVSSYSSPVRRSLNFRVYRSSPLTSTEKRQDVAVQADRGRAEREVLVAVGLDVLVEQDLLAGDLGVLVELGRRPVVGIADRAPAVHARTACPRSCGA